MDDLSPRPRLLAPCGEHVRRLDDLLISWNCRGLRTRLADLKSIISTYQARMRCSSGDISEEYHDSASGYNCVRRGCRWRYISNRRCMPLHV
ncbi:hypothetical protein TNCV_4689591 [Trichonephila clavipes]|nr:hypothetical protein TNCV_4689591 [Trichonephila clavipes]